MSNAAKLALLLALAAIAIAAKPFVMPGDDKGAAAHSQTAAISSAQPVGTDTVDVPVGP